MQVIFSGKNVEVTPALREYAESKIIRLSRFFDHVQEAKVTQTVLRNQHIVEVTLIANGTIIRAEERSADMYNSIDLVIEKLERQLARYKERFVTRTRESLEGQKPHAIVASAEMANFTTGEADTEETLPMIVRTKRFAVKPMDPEEAAMEMELTGHDFFVFLNAENNQVSVIYRRRDGNYGLIEPTLG
ncbi:MAG TPA: ribosome-associated translation inhibitor RaiA [Armatimonadota bacterium]|nr:ribosome-associated translation inhibitor RaiA [Armatimonadota bacterium]